MTSRMLFSSLALDFRKTMARSGCFFPVFCEARDSFPLEWLAAFLRSKRCMMFEIPVKILQSKQTLILHFFSAVHGLVALYFSFC